MEVKSPPPQGEISDEPLGGKSCARAALLLAYQAQRGCNIASFSALLKTLVETRDVFFILLVLAG